MVGKYSLKSKILYIIHATASNIACELQPARTDGLVSGFAKFCASHIFCREEAKNAPVPKLLTRLYVGRYFNITVLEGKNAEEGKKSNIYKSWLDGILWSH